MKVTKLLYDPNLANTYVYGEEGGPCLLIDPGYNRNHALEKYVQKHHSKLVGILLTHGHYDHFAGLKDWDDLSSVPVFLDEMDVPCLTDPKLNCSDSLFDDPLILEGVHPYPFEDGDEIKIGPFILKAIETPFHTLGSSCFYDEETGILFSGDTLFHLGIGRSDLPGSCPRKQQDSLGKLLLLPDKTIVYPGHGPSTTIQNERKYNPSFR